MRLDYNKPLNLALESEHAVHASRVIRCAGTESCKRTIVEYGQHLPETRHAGGIPESTMKLAADAGAVIVDALCDRHGGQEYRPHALVA